MKLTLPPLEIGEDEGFLPEKDIFHRKQFAEELSNLIENVSDELVVALDAPWGEGKTTFVRMWQGMLKEKKIESIYFDAFKNDYLEDPLFALVGEVYSLIGDEKTKKQFKTKAVSAMKVIGKAGFKIGVRGLTAGVVEAADFKGAKVEEKKVTDYISSRLDSLKDDKASIEEFKKTLSKVTETIGGDKKIVFIIDELDRCKPSFALDLLEKIKHIFSISEIVFVLVMNREQMNEIIRSRYGAGIDANKYLQKFVHIWVGLPKLSYGQTSNGKRYLDYCLERMESTMASLYLTTYEVLIDHYNPSLREIEQSLSNYAIIHNIIDREIGPEYLVLAVYLCIVKVLYPSAYRKLASGNLSYEQTIEKTGLYSFKDDYWKDNHISKDIAIPWVLKSCLLGNKGVNDLSKYHTNSEVLLYGKSTIIPRVCKWLDTFKYENT